MSKDDGLEWLDLSKPPDQKVLHYSYGPWIFDREGFVLVHKPRTNEEYVVELARCTSGAEILDWIAQFSRKAWAAADSVGWLARALDEILGLQEHYCGDGVNQEHDPRAAYRAMWPGGTHDTPR